MLRTRILILMLIVIGMGCKYFPLDQIINPGMTLSQLSGTWNASIKVIQKGTCPYNPSEYTSTSTWVVDDAGNVVIEEESQFGSRNTWTGTIDKNLRINVESDQLAYCFPVPDSPRTYTIVLEGQIVRKAGSYELKSLVDNPICPPNCLFDLDYLFKKD